MSMHKVTFQGVARLCGRATRGIVILIMNLERNVSDFISALHLKPLFLIDLPLLLRKNYSTLKTCFEPK